MAFHQTAKRLALVPASRVAAMASTSFPLSGGRYTSSTTTANIASRWVARKAHNAHYQPFSSSSVGKEASKEKMGGTSVDSGGFVQWYEGHLQAQPILTKAITGSILWGLGDFVAQVVPPAFAKDVDDASDGKGVVDVGKTKEFAYDLPRTAKAVFYGFVIHAPLSHVHFNFLEWMTVKAGLQGLRITIFKTVMEQFVYWSWFSNTLYHGAMGVMNGMNMDQIYTRITEVLMPTQYAQWSFWIPVQLLNFQFVPVRHQLNVVLLTSVVWTALLSAWYPPEEKKEEGGEENIE